MSNGVPLDQLQCPTCGARFDLEIQRDDDPDLLQLTTPPTVVRRSNPPYIVCKQGHRWTLKTLWRTENQPDEVLLDRYIGGGELG